MIEKLKSLTYVSWRSRSDHEGLADVEAILSVSRSRNQALSVTGALFSAASTFAQLMEGPAASIDALMESINRDARHRGVKVVAVRTTVARKFPNWSMIYHGDAHYIDIHIRNILDPLLQKVSAQKVALLESLMKEFGKRKRPN